MTCRKSCGEKFLKDDFMLSDFEKNLSASINTLNRNVNELIWANVFHDAIKGCSWLDTENFAIYPGRSAVGYNYFYVVFRILNEFKPKNILETGLGQSSRLIGKYVATHENCRHDIVEHDAAFAEVSQKNFNFSPASVFNVINLIKVRGGEGGGGATSRYSNRL